MKANPYEILRQKIRDAEEDPSAPQGLAEELLGRLETIREQGHIDLNPNDAGCSTADGSSPEADATGTEAMFQATFDAMTDGVLVVDTNGRYLRSNRMFHEIWRIPRHMLVRGQEAAVAQFAMSQVLDSENMFEEAVALNNSPDAERTLVIALRDGRSIECVSTPQVIEQKHTGRVWSFRDITKRVSEEARVRHNAYHDSLTQLPNRSLFNDRLAQALGRARRSGKCAAILLIDLDRFKTINDTLGHPTGDRLLVELSRRLSSRKREGDTVARLGGDEFVFIVSDLRQSEDVAILAEQIFDVLKAPVQIDEHNLHISASIGIALFPAHGTEGTALMKSADVALYRAKEMGRDSYQIFDPRFNERAMEKLILEKDLRRAIHDREFVLHYQPQFELSTGRMRGVEALVRWEHGDEIIPPSRFVPIAEESGLIAPLGRWVLREAARQCVKFNERAAEPMRICVNVSALQIQRAEFALEVSKDLQEAGLPHEQFVIELTESALMLDPGHGSHVMAQLRQMGIGVAMDDFGTGHSSLQYLSVLPVSLIKIDQAFVKNCAKRKIDAAILHAIVTVGHALGLKVLAEGVETEEQASILRRQGCDEVQGYLYGRPVPADQLLEMLGK